MPWKIIEIPVGPESGILTDEELLKLHALVSYGSATYHKTIADKLQEVAKTAAYNINQEQCWENEGGADPEKSKL
jgi:predicted NodU family carbamoyl transferase